MSKSDTTATAPDRNFIAGRYEGRKDMQPEIQRLKDEIASLKTKLNARDRMIYDARDALKANIDG